jgi:dTDP-4-amino-4,6-dideoxygalactose transaminase
MAAFASSQPLPITDHLANSLVALPMGGHVTPAVACRVAAEIRQSVARAREAISA